MKTKPILAAGRLALTLLLGSAMSGHSAAFVPGEILIAYEGTNRIQRYSASGTLLQTFTGTGPSSMGWVGASLTPDGNLVSIYNIPNVGSNATGVTIFNPNGTQIITFPVPGPVFVGDVSVFPNGTLAVSNHGNNTVQLWSQAGTLLKTISTPAWGSTVGADGLLYVGGYDAASGNFGQLNRYDSSGAFRGGRFTNFALGDLVMNPLDSTLWVSGYTNGLVEHITTNGQVLGSFATGLSGQFGGIGLAPDNQSLYVTSKSSTVVEHFDLNGNLLDSFNLISPVVPLFLTVVPAATPEPGCTALLLSGCVFLVFRRRSRGSK